MYICEGCMYIFKNIIPPPFENHFIPQKLIRRIWENK